MNSRSFHWFPAAIFVPLRGTPTWRLHSINFSRAFRQITEQRNTVQIWDLAKLFSCVSFITLQILGFFHRLDLILIFYGVTMKTKNYHKTRIASSKENMHVDIGEKRLQDANAWNLAKSSISKVSTSTVYLLTIWHMTTASVIIFTSIYGLTSCNLLHA